MDRRRLFRLTAALGSAGLTSSLLAACSDAASDKPQNSATAWNNGRLAIGTGGTSGVYYQFGGALADAINSGLPGAVATAQPTGASADNVRRIVRGDAAIALSGDGVPADAYNGTGAFKDIKQPVLALASVFPGVLHLVVRSELGVDEATGAPRPKITNVQELAGLRVSRGGAGSGDDLFSRRVLETAGLSVEDDIVSENMAITDALARIRMPIDKEDAVDAVFASSGVPNSAIATILSEGKHHLVPLGSVSELMRNNYGGYRPSTIRGEGYKIDDLASVEAPTLLLVSDKMPEDLAYDITRVFFEYQKSIGALVPVVNDITKATAADSSPVALHPGAAKYYKENP
ncbi:TAXI family TRAP transporter solute-binding subunit [Phytomonospora sp. NPDC050363]|uniref:TAXI family TRAP transporter solute-binding subunit n=1 Tax=Phytomonospora sp. NPDC050363 TaxID=3155642 RepID=UPI0033FD75D8